MSLFNLLSLNTSPFVTISIFDFGNFSYLLTRLKMFLSKSGSTKPEYLNVPMKFKSESSVINLV